MNSQLIAPTNSEYYHRLPKVDLHRHLEGSIRLDTLLELARIHRLPLPAEADLAALVQVQPGDALDFNTFLAKFQTLRQFYLSPEVIRRISREAVADAAAESIRHLELRFTPMALSRAQGFALAEVMDWVADSVQLASQSCGITTRLIASVNRHESPAAAQQVAALAMKRIRRGIVGLDLAGNESEFPAQPFIEIFRQAKAAGLRITVHAGEWSGAANVRQAIEVLGAERIGHGVRVLEDDGVIELARRRGVVFEVCPTSNHQSGVVTELKAHPLAAMLAAGLKVTLNTDDPAISRIDLSHEYRLAVEKLGISHLQLVHCIRSAALASFLEPEPKAQLIACFEQEFKDTLQQRKTERCTYW